MVLFEYAQHGRVITEWTVEDEPFEDEPFGIAVAVFDESDRSDHPLYPLARDARDFGVFDVIPGDDRGDGPEVGLRAYAANSDLLLDAIDQADLQLTDVSER